MFPVLGLILGAFVGILLNMLRLRSTNALLIASNVLAIVIVGAWVFIVLSAMLSGKGYDSTMATMVFTVWGLLGLSILVSVSLLVGLGLSSFYKDTPIRVARTVFIDSCLLAVIFVVMITSMTKASTQSFTSGNLDRVKANQKADQIMNELPYTFKTIPPESIIEIASDPVPGSLVVPPEVLEKAMEAANLRNPDRERYSPEKVSRRNLLGIATLLSPAIGWFGAVFSLPIYWKRKNLVP